MQRRKKWILLGSSILIIGCILVTFLYGISPKEKVIKFQDGSVYRGTTENGKLVSGVLKFKNGDTYNGSFKDGHFEGKGVYRSHEGWTFEGNFHKGVANGKGELSNGDKVLQKGNYDKGAYQTK